MMETTSYAVLSPHAALPRTRAPFAPGLIDARIFGEGNLVHVSHNLVVAFRLSPSFNWDTCH